MAAQVGDLGRRLGKYYHDGVAVTYVQVFTPQVNEYPEAVRVLARGDVSFAVTLREPQAGLCGGLSLERISAEVEGLGSRRATRDSAEVAVRPWRHPQRRSLGMERGWQSPLSGPRKSCSTVPASPLFSAGCCSSSSPWAH